MPKLQCPRCHAEDDMEVISGSFNTQGVRLSKDGFSLNDADYLDTENEMVRCNSCNETFPLTDVVGYGDGDDEDDTETVDETASAAK